MPTGTGKFRRVIGLYQISWLPLPWRTKEHPRRTKQFAKGAVELWRRLDGGKLGFT